MITNGAVVAAAQEERFTRVKGDASFPINSIHFCLDESDISLDEVDFVAYYDKPLLTFDRLLETYLSFAPVGLSSFVKSMPVWIKSKLFIANEIKNHLATLGCGNFNNNRLRI